MAGTDPQITNDVIIHNIINSVALLLVIVALRVGTLRALRTFPNSEIKRRWIVHIRNFLILGFFLGLIIIWASELRTFAIGVVALAAAIAIATKELILCVLGGVLKASTRPFEIGDRIQVGPFRGDVVDHNFFSTTLYEIGPETKLHQYTGRALEIPNSLFLSNPIINERFGNKYVLHIFTVPISSYSDWQKAEAILLKAAQEECAPYIRLAEESMSKVGEKEGIETPNVEPRVSIHLPDPERIDLIVRIPAPCLRKGKIEQSIVRKYLLEISSL